MRKIIVLCCVFLNIICSAEITYIPIKIKVIPIGNEPGELGYAKDISIPGAGFPKPLDYIITEEDKIYIYDWANNRIGVYDLDLNYLATIKSRNHYFGYMYIMKVDELGNIYLITGDELSKYNNAGNRMISIKGSDIPSNVMTNKNFFPYKGYIFYYSNEYELMCFDQDGQKLEPNKTEELVSEIKTVKRDSSDDMNKDMAEISKSYIKENKKKLLFKGNRLYINDKHEYLKYITFVKKEVEIRNFTKIKTSNKKKIEDYLMLDMLGYDNSDNVYWKSDYSVLIISRYGEIVNNVEYDYTKYANPKVAVNGDIYFWAKSTEGYVFYRIPRQW